MSDTVLFPIETNPLPKGGRGGHFTTSDNLRLRYGLFPRTKSVHKGTVCLVHGRTEFIEKYFETIADFQARGFTVATYDLRGQGGSERMTRNTRHGHVENFSDYWLDLESFHSAVLLPDCPPPFYLVGHSTGGLISLLAATRDRLMFDRVFVTAPMVGLAQFPLRLSSAAKLFGAARFLGLGRVPMGFGAGKPVTAESFAGNPLTSDVTRFSRATETVSAHPELAVGAPTLSWLAAAVSGIRAAQDDAFTQRLQVPVYMLGAALDTVVSTPAIEQVGIRLRSGNYAIIPGARHELFMEADTIRAQVFAAFDAFVTDASR